MTATVNRTLSAAPRGPSPTPTLGLHAVRGIALANAGDDPVALLREGLRGSGLTLEPGDVLVVASKLLSRCEGRGVRLAAVVVTAEAREIAEKSGKDARLVQVILDESAAVSRVANNVLITRHRLGYVSANAAIDASNVTDDADVLLLPLDPDASARLLQRSFAHDAGGPVAVVVTDSFGRPFRAGTVGVALGSAGIEPLADRCGEPDLRGRTMTATWTATVDALAAAADFVMGQGSEAIPAVVIRGALFSSSDVGARSLCRDPATDLYA